MGVNMFVHSLILFSFLSCFFYLYISKIEYDSINGEFNHMITNMLKNVVSDTDKLQFSNITNTDLYKTLVNSYSNAKPEYVNALNNTTKYTVIAINILLWLFLVGGLYLLNYICNININLTHIAIENLITFSLVGCVEYLFFVNIASKFVPIEPSFISKEVLQLLQHKFT
jgi:hypothetical protein